MFDEILWKFKECIRTNRYIVTLHCEEEMDEDELSIFDIEKAILTGTIKERQKDEKTGEWKFLATKLSLLVSALEAQLRGLTSLAKLSLVTR